MDEICKVFQCQTGTMSFFDEDGNQTDPINGFVVEIFVPSEQRAEIDRNDTKRREVTAAMNAAIEIVEG